MFLLILFLYKTDTLQNTRRWVAGLYSGDLAFVYVVGHLLRHQWLAHNVARKLISSKVDSILPDDQSLSVLLPQNIRRLFYCHLKLSKIIAADLTSTKHGFMPASVLQILTAVLSINKLAFLPFQKDYKSCVTGSQNITVLMFAWNQPASIGFLFLIP